MLRSRIVSTPKTSDRAPMRDALTRLKVEKLRLKEEMTRLKTSDP